MREWYKSIGCYWALQIFLLNISFLISYWPELSVSLIPVIALKNHTPTESAFALEKYMEKSFLKNHTSNFFFFLKNMSLKIVINKLKFVVLDFSFWVYKKFMIK